MTTGNASGYQPVLMSGRVMVLSNEPRMSAHGNLALTKDRLSFTRSSFVFGWARHGSFEIALSDIENCATTDIGFEVRTKAGLKFHFLPEGLLRRWTPRGKRDQWYLVVRTAIGYRETPAS